MKATINMNDKVFIELTEKGKEVFMEYAGALSGKPLPKSSADKSLDDVLGIQLRDLLSIFGPSVYKTTKSFFKDGIIHLTDPTR